MKKPDPPNPNNASIGPRPTIEQLQAIRKYEERRAMGERGIPQEEAKRRLESHLRKPRGDVPAR